MQAQIPPTAAVVTHRVADYDTWKSAFDAHLSARKSGSVLGHHIQRAAEDPQEVTVYLPAADEKALSAFLGSSDLKERMSSAGIEGKPTINLVRPQVVDVVRDRPLAGAIVTHRVADYDAWKTVFDADEARRADSGIIGHAVNRSAEDPNTVVVYLQCADMDSLRTFLGGSELKEKMGEAGVQGPPTIKLVEGQEWGEY